MWIRAIVVLALVTGCGEEKPSEPAGDQSARKATSATTTQPPANGETAAPTKPTTADVPRAVDAKPSCRLARYTKPIESFTAELSLAIEGKPFVLEFDPAASYGRSKVWDKPGKVLAACGAVRPRNGKQGTTLFAQFHSGGKHVLRVQLINIPGGYHLLSGGSIAALIELEGNEKPVALSFNAGTYTIAPKPVVPGQVSIKIEGGGGILLGTGKKEKFTLTGNIVGTFAK